MSHWTYQRTQFCTTGHTSAFRRGAIELATDAPFVAWCTARGARACSRISCGSPELPDAAAMLPLPCVFFGVRLEYHPLYALGHGCFQYVLEIAGRSLFWDVHAPPSGSLRL